MPANPTTLITQDGLDELMVECRSILARGQPFGSECGTKARSVTINAIPGNGPFANLVVFTVAGTPTRGAVCVSLTHDQASVSRNLMTGKPLRQLDVAALRRILRRVSGATSHYNVPGDFAWQSSPE